MTKAVGAVASALLLTIGVIGTARLAAHERFRFVGTVVTMDTAEKVLTIKTKVSNADFNAEILITGKTVIERDGKKVPVTELKAGVTVVADALGDDYFDLEGVSIRIVPPIGKK